VSAFIEEKLSQTVPKIWFSYRSVFCGVSADREIYTVTHKSTYKIATYCNF